MIKTERIQFPGAHGDQLAARLELPENTPRAFALFAHCFTCTKDYRAVVRISRSLADSGIAVCRFDFTGLGESEGEFASTNFSSNIEDLVAAAQFLRDRFEAPKVLIGHSLGGAAMLAAASRISEARAVVTLAAPSDTEHLSHRLLRMAPELAQTDEAQITIAGRQFLVRKQLLADLEGHRMSEYLNSLNRPLLILHSPQDEIVDVENAERLFQNASYPKSLVSIEGADHLLGAPADAWKFAAATIELWVSQYLDWSLEESSGEQVVDEQGQVVVRGRAQQSAGEPPDNDL